MENSVNIFLEPSLVLELESMGYSFNESKYVWLCQRDMDFWTPIRRRKKDFYPIQEMETELMMHISAPTTEDLMKVIDFPFELSYLDGEWKIKCHTPNKGVIIYQNSDCPKLIYELLVGLDMLKTLRSKLKKLINYGG